MGAWNETRAERRRRRKRMEEIIGWIVVPPLVLGMWLAGVHVYNAFHEPISQAIEALQLLKDRHL
ncbi:hypothetical protein ACFFJB_08185 [Camelimonas abortus]